MHHIHTPLNISNMPLDTAFLDIETTGLSKTQNAIFCIGLLTFTNCGGQINQYFSTSSDEERLILLAFLEKIEPYKIIFTYGGSHFDLSFIKEKLAFYSIDSGSLFEKIYIDFKKIPLLKGILSNTSWKRTEFEQQLGYNRTHYTSGKDLIKTYKLWEEHQTPIYRDIFLTHNKEELISLYHFYDLYKVNEQMLSQKKCDYVNLKTSICLKIQLKNPFVTNLKFIQDDFIFSWKKHSTYVNIHIDCPLRSLKRYLSPASDYFFIPSQDQIVHKSIAKFIPVELKKKLPQKDCYLQSSGQFIRTYTTKDIDEPIWYDDNKNAYLSFDSDKHTVSSVIQKAVMSVITYCLRGFKA